MSAYFVARIRIHDEALYRKYLETAGRVCERYEAEFLAVDNAPRTLEGKQFNGRVVLIRFPSEEALERWYFSDDYQEILRFRLAAADCEAVMVKGLEPTR
ncbi:MAG TPA: DUF1330 domain-containing protein [Acidobacteriota bacterium]|nr:DUF1330 domain-containing protein [Acidobacteriota bacterium]